MSIGFIAIALSFIASVVSTAAYYQYYREGDERLYQLATRAFFVMFAGIVFSLGMLIFLIQTHDFQVNYVYSYSSRILNKFYLFSTLWAGQEGTFLLWILYGSIYGTILLKTVGRKRPLVMFFLLLSQAFLLLILLKKNPFAMIWHVHENAPVGFTPQDGAGLNPLLQNPWMVIHPPTLFVGYSSTVVPFAFAMAALVRKDFHSWIKEARPWVVFNVMVLGTGIVMGGYWAYTTLGWGGYWGWDPVENASLVPWLFSLVLLHGIVIQSKRQALIRTNFLWAGLSFLTMIWGSFLTRSGVLTDFSVHSFGASGLSFYLIIFQFLFTGLFIGFFVRMLLQYSRENQTVVEFGKGVFNRETFMFAGMMVVLFIALFVLMGTSAPIYTAWFGKAASLSPSFYNTMILPVSIAMLLLMGLAPVLAWKTAGLRNARMVGISAGAAALLTLLAVGLGLSTMESAGDHTPYYAIQGTVGLPDFLNNARELFFDEVLRYSPFALFFLAVFVILVNGRMVYLFLRQNASKAGGYLAHVGLGFMVIGIVTSSVYDTSEKLMLPRGEFARTQFGYEIQFLNFVDMPDGRDRVKLKVKNPFGGTYEAYPQFYYSDYSQAYMVAPDVNMEFTKDVYISPISYTPANAADTREVQFSKMETQTVGDLQITFNKFLVKMGGGTQEVTADLSVTLNSYGKSQQYSLQPMIKAGGGKMESNEVQVPGSGYYLKVASVNASAGTVVLSVRSPQTAGQDKRDMLAVEVSEKPLISVLWFGTIIFICGSFLTLLNRRTRKTQ